MKLPRLISDGMVLQRDAEAKVWGWASPGEKVSLTFQKKKYNATAGKDGKWHITLPPQKAGGPYQMAFKASNEVVVKDILFGDVWVCSGQSNMELTMERVQDKYADIIAQTNNPNIRHFEVPDKYNFKKPNADVESGSWQPATPENILKFSAVAYFFAKDLYAQYKVPVGLINSALGGSPAEAWISEEALKEFPGYYKQAQQFKNDALIDSIETKDKALSNQWYSKLNQNDVGLKQGWAEADFDDEDWSQMTLPGYWADEALGNVNGVVWFRKEINVPKSMAGKPAKLLLGRIVDADEVYINGKKVGNTTYQYPPRRYMFSEDVLKEGKNTIAVRVTSNGGRGGFVLDKPYELLVGDQSIDLKGEWKYKLGAQMEPTPGQTFVRWKPVGLYNAMVAPLTDYRIKGVIWYQGESNIKNPAEYTALMSKLISDWRKQWKQGDFPFIFVQLANFMEPKSTPEKSNWAALRQAQLETLAVPSTGMAVTIDAGEWNDIHPLDKKTVGERLALQARKLAYNDKKVVASGPLLQSVQAQGNKLVLTFANTGSGLATSDNRPLKHFAIAGKDKKFVWANADIQGDRVVVWSDRVADPVFIRYAWADNPEGANLYNKEGLPASPFEATVTREL
ncbi:9-O-acetylesterase [Pontibacter korlensis]|uniref:9-O-acetylesterase n=1 Tax=Pontibacter korlensis TaxID=400092 RepID=A0A0E3UZM3_9BACT|nr:9-O-acetylesterase [Pontibacter korlensis]